MAATSLWSVKGSIGAVIRYAEDLEKTLMREQGILSSPDSGVTVPASSVPDRQAALLSSPDKSMESLTAVLSYAARAEATGNRRLVTGINCSSTHAISDMIAIKRAFSKMDGTVAYHGYQSFREGEVTPEQAHEIGVRLAQELWGDRYQVLVATHMDKPTHVHNHYVLNTVSFVDGKKFFRSRQDYQNMRNVADRLCRENHLSVIRDPQGKGKHYAEWKAEQEGKPTWRSMIRADIDKAIGMSNYPYEVYDYLRDMGYELKFYSKTGERLARPSLKPHDSERFFRFDGLGPDYGPNEISDRVIHNWYPTPHVVFSEEKRHDFVEYRRDHPPKVPVQLTGFGLVLFFFLYMLGVVNKFPEIHPDYPRLTKEDREACMKLEKYDAMVRLMCENKLNTVEDVINFRKEAIERIDELSKVRQKCYDYIRVYRPAPVTDPQESGQEKPKEEKKQEQQDKRPEVPPVIMQAKNDIQGLNEEIRRIRKLLRISEDILKNSERVHAQAEGFGIHERPDGSVRLESPEEQLQSFDKKMAVFAEKLEQELDENNTGRKVMHKHRDDYER